MLFTDWLCTGTVIGKLLWQLMLKVREADKTPASVIFVISSSHWPQRMGRKGGRSKLALGMTSVIYLLERCVLLW